jgi:hypothetical protein
MRCEVNYYLKQCAVMQASLSSTPRPVSTDQLTNKIIMFCKPPVPRPLPWSFALMHFHVAGWGLSGARFFILYKQTARRIFFSRAGESVQTSETLMLKISSNFQGSSSTCSGSPPSTSNTSTKALRCTGPQPPGEPRPRPPPPPAPPRARRRRWLSHTCVTLD